MAKIMTASVSRDEMTEEQVENLLDKVRAAARKHRHEISKDSAQKALGVDNLGVRLFAVYRELVETMSNIIVRVVPVNRDLSHEEHLAATGRKQYINADVVAAMPHSGDDEAKLTYFKPRPVVFDRNGWMSPERLQSEYDFHGLKPDPDAQAADNAADPTFADKIPNACQWKNADGQWCYAAFGRWSGERSVRVRHGDAWRDIWWFAGVTK